MKFPIANLFFLCLYQNSQAYFINDGENDDSPIHMCSTLFSVEHTVCVMWVYNCSRMTQVGEVNTGEL